MMCKLLIHQSLNRTALCQYIVLVAARALVILLENDTSKRHISKYPSI